MDFHENKMCCRQKLNFYLLLMFKIIYLITTRNYDSSSKIYVKKYYLLNTIYFLFLSR